MASPWNWKAKDGSRGGLLYEPGNWGDVLKLLWLDAILDWKAECGGFEYFDPFAGAVRYPLGAAVRRRVAAAGLPPAFRRRLEPWLARGEWPSAAAVAGAAAPGRVAVYDADAGRRESWRGQAGVTILDRDSGWDALGGEPATPGALWLVDPYDVLAEWRERLGAVMERARGATVLLYIYNRSAGSAEAFRDYRAFRAAVADARAGRPWRWGRVAADGFLPRAHHEMLLLPGDADPRDEVERLAAVLEERTLALSRAIERGGLFGGSGD